MTKTSFESPSTPNGQNRRPIARSLPALLWRVALDAWQDSIFARSAQAAFWQTLSLPPLLLGLMGCLGYVGNWFGHDTVQVVQDKIITFGRDIFSANVVDEILSPTVTDMLARGRSGIISFGFLLSLWAGSSALSNFVDSIAVAHNQHDVRHPVAQRLFSVVLYVCSLLVAVIMLPLVALGPTLIGRNLPPSWIPFTSHLWDLIYYPVVAVMLVGALTTLYRVALPRPLPWHRMLIGGIFAGVYFFCASGVLRWYLTVVVQAGYTYGALATPIAFLLFTFSLGFAVIGGAELNAAIQKFWPARPTHVDQWRKWIATQPTITGPIKKMQDSASDRIPRIKSTPSNIDPHRSLDTERGRSLSSNRPPQLAAKNDQPLGEAVRKQRVEG